MRNWWEEQTWKHCMTHCQHNDDGCYIRNDLRLPTTRPVRLTVQWDAEDGKKRKADTAKHYE